MKCSTFFIPIFFEMILTNILNDIIKPRILENITSKSSPLTENIFENIYFKNIQLTTHDGIKIGAWLLAPKNLHEKLNYVIFLHGNNSNRKTFCEGYQIEKIIIKYNLVMLIPDYRDFGDSFGEFSKYTVNYDIDSCFQFMNKVLKRNKIDLIGFSLGTGIALEYCKFLHENIGIENNNYNYNEMKDADELLKLFSKKEKDNSSTKKERKILRKFFKSNKLCKFNAKESSENRINKVIIVAPFKSIVDAILVNLKDKALRIAFNLVRKTLNVTLNYDNYENIQYINNKKLMIFHGRNDGLIPIQQAQELANRAGIKLNSTDDNHTEIMINQKVWKKIMKFLNK